MDVTLDKHYNNVKVLDALNQRVVSAVNEEKGDCMRMGCLLLRHLQVLAASFPECFPPDCMAELKYDCFFGGLPKWLKAMVAYLKASPWEKTYSDYLCAMREAEKEDSVEPS